MARAEGVPLYPTERCLSTEYQGPKSPTSAKVGLDARGMLRVCLGMGEAHPRYLSLRHHHRHRPYLYPCPCRRPYLIVVP